MRPLRRMVRPPHRRRLRAVPGQTQAAVKGHDMKDLTTITTAISLYAAMHPRPSHVTQRQADAI